MASFYWHWTWPTGDRRGYKQFFDPVCVVIPFSRITHWDVEGNTCNVCNQETHYPDQLTVYCTYYVPGQDRQDGYVVYHPACFEPNEAIYLQEAVRLPDREPPRGSGGGPPARNPWDSWKAQGIDHAVIGP